MESLEEIRSRHTFDCVTILNFPPNLFLILPLSPTLSRSLAWFHPFSFYSFDHSTSLVSRYTRIRRTTSIAAELYRSLKRFLRKRTRCSSLGTSRSIDHRYQQYYLDQPTETRRIRLQMCLKKSSPPPFTVVILSKWDQVGRFVPNARQQTHT